LRASRAAVLSLRAGSADTPYALIAHARACSTSMTDLDLIRFVEAQAPARDRVVGRTYCGKQTDPLDVIRIPGSRGGSRTRD
jgi:hypothetical protein